MLSDPDTAAYGAVEVGVTPSHYDEAPQGGKLQGIQKDSSSPNTIYDEAPQGGKMGITRGNSPKSASGNESEYDNINLRSKRRGSHCEHLRLKTPMQNCISKRSHGSP